MESIMESLNHWDADRKEQVLDGSVSLGHLMLYNTPESKYERFPYRDSETGWIITADARIDNREELSGKLNINLEAGKPVLDSLLILEAYKQYGILCNDHLVGAFAYAIWDPDKDQLYCARDHLGFKPFFYLNNNDIFLSASEIKGIKAYQNISLTINELFIADALSTLSSEKDQTFYNEIYRLPPAHYMIVTSQRTTIRRYWNLNPHYELKLSSDKEYINAFKEKLKEAVYCRLQSDYPVGAELSGGLDSSTIVSLASQKQSIKTFSHGLPDSAREKHFPYDDEIKHCRKVIDYNDILDHFFITGEGEGILNPLRKGTHLHEGAMQGTLSEVFEPIYRQAEEEQCRTLLSGYGGDEMVTSPGTGYMFELAANFRLSRLLKELLIINKGKDNRAVKITKQFGKLMLSGLLQKFKPAFETPDWAHDIYHALAIDQTFYKEMNIKERFYKKMKLPARGSTRMQQYIRINLDYVPQRLEYCAIKAQTHKLEYRYPLLDKRLIEFYLSMPPHLKVQNGYGRYILRKSMEGILPPEIQWRLDKTGIVVPSIFLRWRQDEESIRQLILKAKDSNIKHYIDYNKTLDMLKKIVHYDKDSKDRINSQALQSSLMLLMYQLENAEE